MSAPTESWYCLHTQPKHEHIAAAQLRQRAGLQVFVPRIRFRRATRSGPVWVTEPLFLSYFFARFDLDARLHHVRYARGVRDVVHFGTRWPTIPDFVIADLLEGLGADQLQVVEQELCPGDSVEIAGGPLHGLRAVVTRALPANQRVAVLLDFLGRQASVELDRSQLVNASPGAPASPPGWPAQHKPSPPRSFVATAA